MSSDGEICDYTSSKSEMFVDHAALAGVVHKRQSDARASCIEDVHEE
jgi:hypothetical protein